MERPRRIRKGYMSPGAPLHVPPSTLKFRVKRNKESLSGDLQESCSTSQQSLFRCSQEHDETSFCPGNTSRVTSACDISQSNVIIAGATSDARCEAFLPPAALGIVCSSGQTNVSSVDDLPVRYEGTSENETISRQGDTSDCGNIPGPSALARQITCVHGTDQVSSAAGQNVDANMEEPCARESQCAETVTDSSDSDEAPSDAEAQDFDSDVPNDLPGNATDEHIPDWLNESVVNYDQCESTEHLPGANEEHNSSETMYSLLSSFQNEMLPNGHVSKAAALVLIMSFVTAHGIPWSALDDLLHIMNILFGSEVLPRSKHMLRKLWSQKLQCATHYYYCEFCECVLKPAEENDDQLVCPNCQKSYGQSSLRNKGHFFTLLSLSDQVKHVVRKTSQKLFENLQMLNSRAAEDTLNVTDITSAQIYKSLKSSGALKWGDLTVTFSTDGSPVFNSSRASVWPIQLIINEVPAPERFTNPCLAALWFGYKHPNMMLFLNTFVDHLEAMEEINWTHNSVVVSSKVYAICCCVDAPARAMVQNQVMFNGFFGCPWCLAPGEHMDGALRYVKSTADEERQPEMVLRDMEYALTCGIPVNGFKGPSPLINLTNYHLVWGQATEYMHSVLLGVAKQITDHLLDSANSSERFYIGRPDTQRVLNERLKGLRPPHCITRLPRSLSERCHWKATEWRNWLLYYSLPCMEGVLQQKYWCHWSLLVDAIWILNTMEISERMMTRAESLLQRFVEQTMGLYGPRMMSFNMHQLLHLSQSVKQIGPLWAHAAFVFEGGNGRLVKCITAARGAPQQILERFTVMQEVELLPRVIQLPEGPRKLCEHMLYGRKTLVSREVQGATLVGKGKPVTSFSPQEAAALTTLGCATSLRVEEYYRMIYQHKVYTSIRYTRAQLNNSCVIGTHDGEFYVVHRILAVKDNLWTCILLCKQLITIDSAFPYPEHIKECFCSMQDLFVAVKVEQLSNVCLFLELADEGKAFVCVQPNTIEVD